MSEKVFFKVAGMIFDLPTKLIGFADLIRVEKGWVVKVKNATDFEGEDGMIQAVSIALKTTKAVSGYKDGDVELWDVIEIYQMQAAAERAAKVNGQMTIYQIETGRIKWID